MSHEAKDGRRGRRGRPDVASRRFGVETLERRELLAGNAIGGFVYHDADGNGRFDSGEAPIANSPIELLNASASSWARPRRMRRARTSSRPTARSRSPRRPCLAR
ncbi:MAG: hypothetical protein WKF75_13175 [Singulisphaera sp.]